MSSAWHRSRSPSLPALSRPTPPCSFSLLNQYPPRLAQPFIFCAPTDSPLARALSNDSAAQGWGYNYIGCVVAFISRPTFEPPRLGHRWPRLRRVGEDRLSCVLGATALRSSGRKRRIDLPPMWEASFDESCRGRNDENGVLMCPRSGLQCRVVVWLPFICFSRFPGSLRLYSAFGSLRTLQARFPSAVAVCCRCALPHWRCSRDILQQPPAATVLSRPSRPGHPI